MRNCTSLKISQYNIRISTRKSSDNLKLIDALTKIEKKQINDFST